MTVIELVNMAFAKIGVTKGIVALTDATPQAYLGELFYDHRLRLALRRWPWPFATKYATLSLTQGGPIPSETSHIQGWDAAATYNAGDLVRVGGVNYYALSSHTNHTPPDATYWETQADHTVASANGDWVYGYRWPTDCLFARRLVPPGGDGRRYSTDFALPFRVGRDANGLLIYTAQPDAVLEYTVISCGSLWADDLFLDWFSWEMATVFAPAHAKSKDHWDKATQMAEATFLTAAAVAAREGEPQRQGDAEWIEAR